MKTSYFVLFSLWIFHTSGLPTEYSLGDERENEDNVATSENPNLKNEIHPTEDNLISNIEILSLTEQIITTSLDEATTEIFYDVIETTSKENDSTPSTTQNIEDLFESNEEESSQEDDSSEQDDSSEEGDGIKEDILKKVDINENLVKSYDENVSKEDLDENEKDITDSNSQPNLVSNVIYSESISNRFSDNLAQENYSYPGITTISGSENIKSDVSDTTGEILYDTNNDENTKSGSYSSLVNSDTTTVDISGKVSNSNAEINPTTTSSESLKTRNEVTTINSNTKSTITITSVNPNSITLDLSQNDQFDLFSGIPTTPSTESNTEPELKTTIVETVTSPGITGLTPSQNLNFFGRINDEQPNVSVIQKEKVTVSEVQPLKEAATPATLPVLTPSQNFKLSDKFADEQSEVLTSVTEKEKITLSEEVQPPKKDDENKFKTSTEGLVQAVFAGEITLSSSSTDATPRRGFLFNFQNLGSYNLASISRSSAGFNRNSKLVESTQVASKETETKENGTGKLEFSLGIINKYAHSNIHIDTINLGKTGSINRAGESKPMLYNGFHIHQPTLGKFL